MPKITKLELDKKLKEWITESETKNKTIQKGIGSGLLVVIQKTGKADYFSRTPFQKLGAVNKVTLANAYKKAESLKPKKVERKKRSTAPTLKEYFAEWIEEKKKTLKKGGKSECNITSLFNLTLSPIHNMKLDDLTLAMVNDRLTALGQTDGNKHNAVMYLNQMLNNAMLKGIITSNPLQGLNPFKKPKKIHYKSVPYSELKAKFFEPLSNVPLVNKVFYLLIALVGFRFNECRLLRWSWIDFEKGIITIPATAEGANKTQTDYKKPMAKQTMQLLRYWQTITAVLHSDYVFTSTDVRLKSGVICEGCFREPLKALTTREHDFHGFRQNIKTFLGDRGYNAYISEATLSHDIRNNLEKTYDRGERIEPVRKAVQEWADYLTAEQITPEYKELIQAE